MSTLSAEMEFEIGDEVYMRSSPHNAAQRPNKFIVVERILQQCHGGVQRMYMLDRGKELYAEIVLTKDIPPYDTSLDRDGYEDAMAMIAAIRGKD